MMRDFSSRPRKAAGGLRDGLFLTVAVLASLLAVWAAAVARGDLTRVRGELEAVRREIASGAARARTASPRDAETRGALSSRVLLTVGAPPPSVVAELTALLPADVRLKDLSLAYGQRLLVEMRVEARSAAAYDMFLDRLQRSSRFTGVLPGVENRDGAVTATVRALYQGEGAL